MENAMKLHGLHVRIEEKLVDGMKVLKSRTRKPMGIIIEEALKDYLKKHDIQLEQPETNV
jgi:predicted transcriptional regulator